VPFAPEPVCDKAEAVPYAPQDEMPACSMPEAAEEHCYHEVGICTLATELVATKAYVQVIT